MSLLAEAWADFEKHLRESGMPVATSARARSIFYAGAASFYVALLTPPEREEDITLSRASTRLKGLSEELREYLVIRRKVDVSQDN